jgi:hypothetical protein
VTTNQTKAHVAAVHAQARKIVELHNRYKVTAKDLAKRFDCSAMLIQGILKKEKKKRSLKDSL